MLITILVVLLLLMLLSGPYTGWHSYGWGPSGGWGVILVIILIVFLVGGIR